MLTLRLRLRLPDDPTANSCLQQFKADLAARPELSAQLGVEAWGTSVVIECRDQQDADRKDKAVSELAERHKIGVIQATNEG